MLNGPSYNYLMEIVACQLFVTEVHHMAEHATLASFIPRWFRYRVAHARIGESMYAPRQFY